MDDTEITQSLPALVDDNGLTELFANRVRAQILVASLYTDEPLPVVEIVDAVGVTQSTVYEAFDHLAECGRRPVGPLRASSPTVVRLRL